MATGKEVWQNTPPAYAGRWGFEFDARQNSFFVHCNGHRICDAEDWTVAEAICNAHNRDTETV